MKIERHFVAEMSIFKFADIHDLVMEVHEREHPQNPNMRFYAYFKRAETKDGSILSSEHGNGSTERSAIDDYARKLSLKMLVVDAMWSERKEIKVPRLV